MSNDQIPRVTYSNIGTDFASLHAFLDAEIPAACTRLIGRRWGNRIAGRDDVSGEVVRSVSPIDREIVIGEQIAADAGAIERAVAAARRAYPVWSRTPWPDRVQHLRRFGAVLSKRKYELGIACLIEVGKSRLEALGEAEEAVDLVGYYAAEMERNAGFDRPMARAFPHESTRDLLRPMGVFAVVAPFNFPLALSVNMLTGAIITGNTAVYKPSQNAGLTGALLMQAMEEAGIPEGVVNLVAGGDEVGRALTSHPGIAGVAFTGSYAVGMDLFRRFAAGAVARPVVVEMGGKNPAYVAASADVETAAQGVMRSAFGLSGQKCSACSKVYVHTSLKARFLDRLAELTRAIALGDVRRRDVYMGPVIDERAAARLLEASAQARRDGYVVTGGERLAEGLFDRGPYVAPTIVQGLASRHPINKDELFLPFLSVIEFGRLEDAIADGNDVAFGLTAGCYADDERELQTFLDAAEAGVLYANRASGATTGAWPGIQSFCGWKGSGITGKGGLGPHYLPQFMREQSQTIFEKR